MTTEKTNEVPASAGGCSLDSLVLPDLYRAAGKYWWWSGQMSGTDKLLEPLRDDGTMTPFAADKCRKATMAEMDEQIPAILYFLTKEVYRQKTNCDHQFWFQCKCGKSVCSKCGGEYDGQNDEVSDGATVAGESNAKKTN